MNRVVTHVLYVHRKPHIEPDVISDKAVLTKHKLKFDVD